MANDLHHNGEPGLVSIIVPAYNAAAYIGQTIASVQDQTYRRWELLVCDDGSTDETAGIAKRMGAPVIHHDSNRGVAAARNSALAHVQGEYLTFLDADDVWEPTFLQRALEVLSNSDAGISFTNGYRINERGERLEAFYRRNPLPPSSRATLMKMVRVNFLSPSWVILRRTTLQSMCTLDEAFDVYLPPAEDWDLWLRLLAHGARFCYLDEHLAGYRVHQASSSHQGDRMLIGQRRVLRKHLALQAADLALQKALLQSLARHEAVHALRLAGRKDRARAFNLALWVVRRRPLAFYDVLVLPRMRRATLAAMAWLEGGARH